MKREPFFKLHNLFYTRGLFVNTSNVKIEEQVAMLLDTLEHSVHNHAIWFNFQWSKKIVIRFFNAGLYVVGESWHEMIKLSTL